MQSRSLAPPRSIPCSWLLAGLTGLLAIATAPASAGEIVASVGDATISSEDLRAAGATPGDTESVRRALGTQWDQLLLAGEARTLLGLTEPTSDQEAARALRSHLFNPTQRCQNIPEALRRQRYEETSWRFVAPPAWTVDDVQVLCCRNPRKCDTPEVAECLDSKRALGTTLRKSFDDVVGAEGFRAAFETGKKMAPKLAMKRYVFYFDPAPEAPPVHWRLQTVDRPVAEAVAGLDPGQVAPLVTSRFGHHILRLDALRPGIDLRWEDPRTQAILRTELCPAHLLEAQMRYLRDLRKLLPLELKATALQSAFGAEMEALGLRGQEPR